MKTYRIEILKEAKEEFDSLDKGQRKLILKQLIKLEIALFYGKHLANKMDINLSGFYKLYVDKKKLRIIYAVDKDVVKVIAIGKRENMDVYIKAFQRVKDYLKED